MPTKPEVKRKNDNKTSNQKSADSITLGIDPDRSKPVRRLPKK